MMAIFSRQHNGFISEPDKAAKCGVRFRWTSLSTVGKGLLVLAVVLALVRVALPSILKSNINGRLGSLGEYRGRVEDVQVQLWRGGYKIRGVVISKTGAVTASPLFEAQAIDLNIQWKELFHGFLVGEVMMDRPTVRFVSASTASQSQSGKEVAWNGVLEKLFPFRLNRFEAREGTVRFINPHSTPAVDIQVEHLMVVATNIANTKAVESGLATGVTATGMTIGGRELALELHLDLLAQNPTFEISTTLTNVNLPALNDFLRAYGKFDVERGRFAMFTSVASKEGSYEGYVKVFFEDLDVFEWRKERGKNALAVFWQTIVGAVTTVFKNHPQDRLATRIPFAGSYSGMKVGVGSAIVTLLRNAFVRALVPKLDEQAKIEEVEIKSDLTKPTEMEK
jgi:hypothetical protein